MNAKVNCSDGPYGKLICLVLMPTNEEITHVVVAEDSYSEIQYLVPIERISESTPELIRLKCSREELLKMTVFNQVEFIPSGLNGAYGGFSMVWPYAIPAVGYITVDHEHVPADELAIRRGASVEATDGHVGRVDEFLIDPANGAISHLLLREGHFWGQKDISVPLSQIDRIEENTVWLKLDKKSIEALPAIPIHHGRPDKE
ncbi:MAG: PRC-barrel domain-containing protein [Anaerolineales bacterium]